MSTTLSSPIPRQSKRVAAAAAAVLLVAGLAVILAGGDRAEPSAQAPPAPARAWPGELTAGERAAVAAALTSEDPRSRRIASSVAAGQAGALALADPAILYHHGVNTSAVPADRGRRSAERFHHR